MANQQNLTTSDSARKIIGANFISLEEALKIFPSDEIQPAEYEQIPFSNELLYLLSEPESNYPFILIPGLPKFNGGVFTLKAIRNFFLKTFPKLFAQADLFENPNANFANSVTGSAKWYLFSKKVLPYWEIRDFLINKEIAPLNDKGKAVSAWQAESAVVYVYSWLLFMYLRGEEIFQENRFYTRDEYKNQQIVVHLKDKTVKFASWRRRIQLTPESPFVIPSLHPDIL